jgi:hypothetical protein
MRNAGGNLYISTTTVAGTATTSTSALTILNGGNVGIGTTTPLARLGFDTTTTAAGGINFGDAVANLYRSAAGRITTDGALSVGDVIYSNGLNAGTYYFGWAGGGMGNAANGGIISFSGTQSTATTTIANGLTVNTSSLVVQQATGNVGVGTTTPNTKLSVQSIGLTNPILGHFVQYSDTNVSNVIQNSQGTWAFSVMNSGNSGNLWITPNTSFSNPALVLTTTGNIGVGTTSPGSLFSIGGNATGWNFFDNATTTSNAKGIDLRNGGCFAVNGTCIGSGSSITGSTGQVAYFNGTNTAIGTSTLFITTSGSVGVGTTSPYGRLTVDGVATSSGANAIAGIYSNVSLTNSTTNGFQFGNRFLTTINGSVAGTQDGMFIRTVDNTSLANTVRGLEVQAYSGNNTNGVNEGIATFGKTFGLYAYTDGLAGGVSVPAAILGELGHQTSGNAIRAYTATGTTATLLSVYQESSVFTGTGLTIDLGNTGTGSGSFNSGYFMNLKKAGTSKFVIDSNGYVGIGSTTPTALLSLQPTASIQDIFRVSTSTPGFGGPALAVSWYGGLTQNISSTTALNIQDGKSNSIFTVDTTQSSTNAGIDITAGASQTGNLLNLYSSGGTYLSGFTASGGLLMNLSSTTAIDVWNGSASPIFRVDTVNKWLYLATSTSPTFTADGQIAIGNADTTASGGRIWIRSGATTFRFTSSANTADYSEFFYTPATSSAKSVGTIMSVDTGTTSPVVGTGAVIPSTVPYDENLIGAVSMNGTSYNNPEDTRQTNNNFANVGMLGHIPVLISDFSEPIHVGDYITSSGENGKGMKATKSGMVLGSALEDYTPASSTSRMILVLVNPGYKVIGTANDIFATTTIAEILGPNSTSSPQTWSSAFADASETLRNAISSLGDVVVRVSNDVQYAAVGIYNKIFAKEVHTDKLCVEDVCVTKQEFVKMVQMANTSSATGGSTSVTTSSTGPTITLFGNNPAEISVGVVYSDLGVSAKDSSGNELGYTVSVDGATSTEPSLMNIDTSISGSHQIIYRAVDGAGNSASATRVVNVVDITTNSSGSTTDTTSSSTPSTDSTDVATSSPSN